MPNDNCLEGFKCPECAHEDSFEIAVTISTTCHVTDDGTDDSDADDRSTEWEHDSDCKCTECDHEGVVSDFAPETFPAPEKKEIDTSLHALDPRTWLDTVWDALHCHRENSIPEGVDNNDEEWDEITSAMSYISEELGYEEQMHGQSEPDAPVCARHFLRQTLDKLTDIAIDLDGEVEADVAGLRIEIQEYLERKKPE